MAVVVGQGLTTRNSTIQYIYLSINIVIRNRKKRIGVVFTVTVVKVGNHENQIKLLEYRYDMEGVL